jgi:hypothetical protein
MIAYIALTSELLRTGVKAPIHFFAGAMLYAFIVLAIPFFDHFDPAHH